MRNALKVALPVAAAMVAVAAYSAGSDQHGIVTGSLWKRPMTWADFETKSLIKSPAKPPTVVMCSANCVVEVKNVTYAAGTCSMEIVPEVMVLKGSNVSVKWKVTKADHKFKDKNDIEFDGKPWRPNHNTASGELDITVPETGVLKYHITAHKRANEDDGCNVDPIIVNTG